MANKRQRPRLHDTPTRSRAADVVQPAQGFYAALDQGGTAAAGRPIRLPEMSRPVEPISAAPSTGTRGVDRPPANIDLLLDVDLPVSIELGRTQMSVADLLELKAGTIVELDRLAGEPVDILVNNSPVAKGEVVVVDDNFAVRVTSLLSSRLRGPRTQKAATAPVGSRPDETDPSSLP